MKLRDRLPRGDGWWSRAWLSAVLAWAIVAVLAVLPLSAGTTQRATADASAVTVTGPPVWQPAAGKYGPTGSITVTPTTGLADQIVHVSWKGFTPTVDTQGNPVTSVPEGDPNKLYAVRVYQCRGTNPGPTDCYGAELYNGIPADGFQQAAPAAGRSPEFPANRAIAVTAPDGTGQANVEVWTAAQSQTLGCDSTHPCSLVLEPNYGGDAVGVDALINGDPTGATNCDDHSYDNDGFFNEASDATVLSYPNVVNSNQTGEACAWTHRTVVPLSFSPTAADCKTGPADLTIAGLEMANRAVQQWRSGLCLSTSSPLNVQYNFGGGEPLARRNFLKGSGADVALTALPDTTPTAPRPYVYAPLANAGISVAFEVDNPATGRQITQMRLNARLLAKELTQSYTSTPTAAFDPASVAGNPACIFEDQEFLALNPPSLIAPETWPKCAPGVPSSLPIVVGGATDLVQQLTDWIAADPQAAAFLQGQPDPWGMHVDTYYLRPGFAGYPVNAFVAEDSSGAGSQPHAKQYDWTPQLGGLGQVARHILSDTPTCQAPLADATGNHAACPAELPGTRQLIAVLDTGEAEAFSLPEAQLLNAQGSFVAPSIGSMQAAVGDMPVDPLTGTQQLPYGASGTPYAADPNAYPLTTVQYAMVPTAGLSAAKASAVSQFVQSVTALGGGQLYGPDPGKLAVGYADLTSAQQAQAQAAANHVAAQDGALPGNQQPAAAPAPAATANPAGEATSASIAPVAAAGGAAEPAAAAAAGTTGGDGAAAPATTPTGSKPATGTPSPGGTQPALAPVAAGQPAPDRAGTARLLLPLVLIAGAVLLLGGPAALVLAGTAAGGRLLNRLRRRT
ncbi:hypothetical protein P3T36_004975 [Kitasatospora sp. MAP12-15]|uniref:hypothetical protein n=1 Tax=unclassified Kitasatospora TaxID=2633591 RepID=UPI0024756104|nr:hypothetical protein [Kitasatospora sp. MAP12-44]MDH6112048.1 hypothetical protein [Kitasatospora sp. MAP12-44]